MFVNYFVVAIDVGECKEELLSQEQALVLDCVSRGENIFFTGAGGTGKSFLLHRIIDKCRGSFGKEAVFITASTGIAAAHLGGTTLHSFAGMVSSMLFAKS
jgi:ATP-dependent DNA helicase PIF1